MSASQLLELVAVWTIAAATPGPDIVLVLARAFSSRRAGLAAGAGVVTGVGIWLAATFAGLATVLQAAPAVMPWMALVGGCFLVWMGAFGLWGAYREKRRGARGSAAESRRTSSSGDDAASRPRGLWGDFLRGLATNLSNPKAMVFFGAMLAPFLSPAGGEQLSAPALAGLYVLLLGLAAAVFATVAALAGAPALNRRIAGALPWVDVVAGVLFVIVGVAVAVGGVRHLAGV